MRGNHERRETTRKSGLMFRLISCFMWLLVLLQSGGIKPANAHPISLTDAVVDVRPDEISVRVKVLVEDLILYHSVSADGEGVFPSAELQKAAEAHDKFVIAGLKLLDQNGKRLIGELKTVDSTEIPEEGVAQTAVKQVAVVYLLTFSVDEPLQFLTVSQEFGGLQAVLPAMMDCQVKQAGVVLDVPQPLMSGQTLTTKFDWSKPPIPPKNWRELKQRRKERLRDRLGIASYSGLYSFLYITPKEVRHEILIPLLTLEEWLPIERDDSDSLTVNEQKNTVEAIKSLFESRSTLLINEERCEATVTRVNFFGPDIRDFALNAEPLPVSMAQARVGVIVSYPAKTDPQRVQLRWESFSRYAPFLKSVVFAFDEKPSEHFFRPDEREFKWEAGEAFNRNSPSRSEVVAQSPPRNLHDAQRIATALIEIVYGAFDLNGEEETYDELAKAVEGRLLRTLYLQVRKSLLMAEQGGSQSRILKITPVSSRLLGRPTADSFEIEYSWRVAGSVEHWGHVHTRENELTAKLSVRNVDGHWKLGGVRFLSQRRVRFETRLRGFTEK